MCTCVVCVCVCPVISGCVCVCACVVWVRVLCVCGCCENCIPYSAKFSWNLIFAYFEHYSIRSAYHVEKLTTNLFSEMFYRLFHKN